MSPVAKRRRSRILVVEDDDAVRGPLVEALGLDGYQAGGAASLDLARRELKRSACDMLLLDLNLPDGVGYELLGELRDGRLRSGGRSLAQLPVIIVSGRGQEYERIHAFERGCDDYLVKPFSFGELRGRIAAVLRRQGAPARSDLIDLDELVIDTKRREVEMLGRRLTLTDKEFSLLVALAADPERVFERDELLGRVWGYAPGNNTRTLDSHACRLRGKLSGGERRYVHNCWGVGYRLLVPPAVS